VPDITLDLKIENKKKIEMRKKENRIKLSPTSIILTIWTLLPGDLILFS